VLARGLHGRPYRAGSVAGRVPDRGYASLRGMVARALVSSLGAGPRCDTALPKVSLLAAAQVAQCCPLHRLGGD
jgi:hypothetical protein